MKRGRPATGRKDTYYVPDVKIFQNKIRKENVDRLVNAYNTLANLAYDVDLTYSEKKTLKKLINEEYNEI